MPSFAYKHTAFATQRCKGVFLVNCPSDTYGAKETYSFLQALENGAESDGSLVKHIGDGESDLEFAQMWTAWREFERELAPSEPICIVIRSQGKKEGRKHYSRLGQGLWIRTELLLQEFRSQSTKTRMMSVFLPSAYSNSARKAVNVLSKRSVLVTTSDIVFSNLDMERWTNALTEYWPKRARAVDLFYLYLVKSLGNRFMPRMSVAR